MQNIKEKEKIYLKKKEKEMGTSFLGKQILKDEKRNKQRVVRERGKGQGVNTIFTLQDWKPFSTGLTNPL